MCSTSITRIISWRIGPSPRSDRMDRLALPPELNESFREEIQRFEEDRKMPYVTSIERLAREEGRQEGIEGLRKGILELLKSKFPGAGAKYCRKVRAERDIER